MHSGDPNIATCPSCATLIDVSEVEPFSLVNCSSCGAQMRVRTTFANFELQGLLGEGGQGRVFRAVDRMLNRPVAIKVMKREYSADPDFVARFGSEARITASLNSPHIVKVYSSGEHAGLLYLAMEVVDHGSLESLIASAKKVPEARVVDIGIQIATGLKAGLERGLIHRDIKPGNILFADERTAKIVDFGLAILAEKQHEEQGEVWATPYYVSPEKLDGQHEDFRSDMYSLAATLFHAIAGRPPFISESNSMAELRRIKSAPVRLLNFAPHVSSATAHAIDRALSFHPKDRFPSYDDFILNLEVARAEATKRKPAKTRRGPRVLKMGDPTRGGSWVTFATVALVVGIGVYFWLNRDRRTAPQPTTQTTAPRTPSQEESLRAAEAKFDDARRLLVTGDFSDAARTFRALADEGRLPEPKNTWAAIHHGFAALLAGQTRMGRESLQALTGRISPNVIGMDAKLIAFAARLAEMASLPPRKQPEMADVDAKSYETLQFFISGLLQWNAGEWDGGAARMRRFQSATPQGDSAWVGDYRVLVTRFMEEYAGYTEISTALAKHTTAPAEADAALKKYADLREKLRSKQMIQELDTLADDAREKVKVALGAAETAMKQKQAEAEAAEDALLTEAKFRIKALCENYQFTEAATLIRAVNVKLERAVSERDLLAKRVDWLVQFKAQLIRDLNTVGCTLPLQRKTGQQILGGVAKAGEQQLDVRVQFGSLPLQWKELSPKSILQMARFYMRPGLPAADLAERKWRAGVFCLFTQLFNEGQLLLEEAAAENTAYQNDRALFFGQSTPEPQPAPDATIPGTGTEMSEQPLNSAGRPPGTGLLPSGPR